jgi:7,8-dihydropterin-6-yl-methyl-4-(beta-D-ribofuranosyl)aminobenzene 5'-phosphate synthase
MNTKQIGLWVGALLILFSLVNCAAPTQTVPIQATKRANQITVIYDAFGKDASMKKDWGYSALVEVAGKRILFDTGDDAAIFAQNVKVKGIDLRQLDFVVLSHRHSDHMAGLSHVLNVNPKVKIYAPKEGFGIYGSSLPSGFYRKNESLPPEMRYYDGAPPAVMQFGTAWAGANFEPIDKTTEVAPGVWLIALVSDAVGTKELRELSLAIDTPNGIVLLVGCSHPGIEAIVEAASKINKKIHLLAGGFHLVVAQDDVIAKISTSLRDTWQVANIAPGHCTGEPTFAALKQAFGDRYWYAGLGSVLPLNIGASTSGLRGDAALLSGEELKLYQHFARLSHDAQDAKLAHSGASDAAD